MGIIKNERVEILEYLKQSIQRMRETARAHPDKLRAQILETADRIAEDTAKLEHQMIEAGYVPEAANSR
jgi:hypothetical protein